MPEIVQACLLSSYKGMVAVETHMVKSSKSMRRYLKGTSCSPLTQFSDWSVDKNDLGDGGGIPIFVLSSIASFEKSSAELVQTLIMEVNLISRGFVVYELQRFRNPLSSLV